MENHHSTPADAVSNRKRYILSLCLLWLLGSALAASNFFIHSSQNPLGYDEGDYYEAVQRGWWLNWIDADNIPLAEYISLARRAVQGNMTKAGLSNYIREKQSTMFLRHEHSSVAFYPALALRPFVQHLPLHEQLRLANLAWILLWFTFLCVVFLCYPDTFSPWIILLPASASFAMSSAGYNMHIPFGLVVSAFLYCWFLYALQPQKRGLKILTLFLLAATLITVEYGMFIAAFLFLWAIVKVRQTDRKKELLVGWGKNILWVMGFITVLWPSSLFTLGLMRSYALQIYMTLFRLPADTTRYSSLLEMLYNKWNASPLELLIAVLLLGVLLRYWRLMFRYGSFFVASCFLLVLICFHFTMRVTLWWYLFPFFAILFSFYIPALFRLRIFSPRWQKSLPVAAGVALLFWSSALWMVHIPRSEQTVRIHDIVRSTPSNHILVPLSIYTQIKRYFPSKKLVRYHDTNYDTEFLDDSVHVWRRQGMVIVPRQFATKIRQQFNDSTESYLVFESVP